MQLISWRDQQVRADYERQMFWKTFHGNFSYSRRVVVRNLLRGSCRRNSYLRLVRTSNRLTHSLLNYSDFHLNFLKLKPVYGFIHVKNFARKSRKWSSSKFFFFCEFTKCVMCHGVAHSYWSHMSLTPRSSNSDKKKLLIIDLYYSPLTNGILKEIWIDNAAGPKWWILTLFLI